MSVLETPRIYFRGQIAWDPIVTNNYSKFYDEDTSEPVYPSVVNKVAAFRQEAIDFVVGGNWNPQGTHRSSFFETGISGADLGSGLVTDDKFVGAPALIMGMLVDLEPYGTFSSQLFFDAMSFGILGGYRIAAARNTRITSRYINFFRCAAGARAGIASVVWQACFAKGQGLRIDAYDSNALQALQAALEDDDVLGLTVQFNTYRTIYYNNPVNKTSELVPDGKALTQKLNCGGFQPNPARSMVVGVIGLWRNGEPANEPCDRTLITGPADPQGPPTVGSLHARLTSDSITLDLSNSISEDNLELVKHDFGTLTVSAIDPATNQPVTLASFDYSAYDKDAYDATSGIVTLPVDPQNASVAATATLQLSSSLGVLQSESQYRALPLVPNLYMNQGETQNVQFQVYDRGVPAGAGVPVLICVMSADASSIVSTMSLTTGANGQVSFPVEGTTGSITPYVAVPGPNPAQPTQGIDPQVNTFAYVRVLSADDDIAGLEPTFENVYCRVLANWNAMAPCMDNWLDLANEAQVRSFGPMIKKLTDPAAFENFRYMPVTRDLTPGERTLLYNFLDAPVPEAVPMLKATAETAEEPETKFAKLSRKLRS